MSEETAFEAYQRGLREALPRNIVNIRFSKVNGDIRVMKCTLMAEHLPDPLNEDLSMSRRPPNPNTTCVWDLEKNDWRSFRNDLLRSWAIEETTLPEEHP